MTGADISSLHAPLLVGVKAFLDYEADLLDRLALREWLDLWQPSGLYIVPIEQNAEDAVNQLNHVYDNDVMRSQRVERLLGGLAPSATPPTRTIRSMSRVRIMERMNDSINVSSAMIIVGYKRQTKFLVAANVVHQLHQSRDAFCIAGKTVTLIDSDEPLGNMSFLL